MAEFPKEAVLEFLAAIRKSSGIFEPEVEESFAECMGYAWRWPKDTPPEHKAYQCLLVEERKEVAGHWDGEQWKTTDGVVITPDYWRFFFPGEDGFV